MLRDIVELALSYVQHLILLINIAPIFFPNFYSSPADVLKVLNLDLNKYIGEGNRDSNLLNVSIPDEIPLDIRLQFFLISVCVPLLIYLVGLIALGRKLFYLWYLFMVFSTLALTIGVTHFVVRDPWLDSVLSDLWAGIITYAGAGLTVLCGVIIAVVFFCKYWVSSSEDDDESSKSNNEIGGAVAAVVPSSPSRRTSQLSPSRRSTALFGGALRRHSSAFFREDTAIEQALQGGVAARGGDMEAGEGGHVGGSAVGLGGGLEGGSEGEYSSQSTDAARIRAHLDEIMQSEVSKVNIKHTIERFISFLIFLALGLFLVRAIVIPGFVDDVSDGVYPLVFAAGIVSLTLSLASLVWFIVGLFPQGRVYQFHIGVFVRDNFVSALLLLVSVIYIPAVTNVIILFNCQDVKCAEATRLPDARSTVWLTSSSVKCEPCLAASVIQNCNATFAESVCSASVGDRLQYDTSVPCADLKVFFWPASGIILLSFVISTPLLNYILTRASTEKLERDFPVDPRQVAGFNEEEIYFEKVHQSDNVARFIYDPFLKRYKHWRMLFLIQKLLIVLVSVFTFNVSVMSAESFGIAMSLIIHFIVLCYVLFARPFTRKVENLFTVVTQLFLCVTAAVGLSASVGDEPPAELGKTVAVLTYVVPIVALALGAMLTFRDDMALEQRRDDRSRKARHNANEVAADGGSLDEEGNNIPLHLTDSTEDGAAAGGGATQFGEGEKGFNSGIVDGRLVTNNDRSVELLTHRDRHLAIEMRTLAAKPGLAGGYSPLCRHETYLSKNPLARQRLAEKEAKQLALIAEARNAEQIGVSITTVPVGSPQRLAPLGSPIGAPPLSPTCVPSFNVLEGSAGNSKSKLGASIEPPAFTPPVLLPATTMMEGDGTTRTPKADRLTFDQSLRARRNWSKTRAVLLNHVRDLRSKGIPVGLGNLTSRKSFFGEAGAAGAGEGAMAAGVIDGAAMKQWDNLLLSLLNADKRKQIAAEQAKNLAESAAATSHASLAGAAVRAKNRLAITNKMAAPANKRKQSVAVRSGSQPGSVVEDGDELRTGAAGKRQQMRLRIRLREIYEHHLLKLINTQRAVDFQINHLTIVVLMVLFVLFSICVFVALAISFLGIMSSDQGDAYFVAHTSSDSLKEQLLGLDSWDNFTSSCCCLPFSNMTPGWPYYVIDVEKWVCDIRPSGEVTSLRADGVKYQSASTTVKERIRRAVGAGGAIENGLLIRPLCGMAFVNNCSLAVNSVSGTVALVNCDGNVPSNAKEFY